MLCAEGENILIFVEMKQYHNNMKNLKVYMDNSISAC